ncbi:hypothetical protein LguiB_025204 [Lonicera macranthoides]
MALPGGYKTPFITFSGEDKQSTVEHPARFLCQIGEAAGPPRSFKDEAFSKFPHGLINYEVDDVI